MGKSNAPSKTGSTPNKTTDIAKSTDTTSPQSAGTTTGTPSSSFTSPVTGQPATIRLASNAVYQWRATLRMQGDLTEEVSALPKIGPEQRPVTEAGLRLLNRRPSVMQATGITTEYTTSLMAHRDAAAQVSSACASQSQVANCGYLLLSGAMDSLDNQGLNTANGMAANLTLPWARRSDIRDEWKLPNQFAIVPAAKTATTKATNKKKTKATAASVANLRAKSQAARNQGLLRASATNEVTAPQKALAIPGTPGKR